jgi:hypothetical protein
MEADFPRGNWLRSGEADEETRVHHTIYIRDELILEAYTPHILLRRAGEPDTVRYLVDALCSMAAEMAGTVVGDG